MKLKQQPQPQPQAQSQPCQHKYDDDDDHGTGGDQRTVSIVPRGSSMMVTRPRSQQGPLVALNHLIWHGVEAGDGIGIVSTRGSMSINHSAPRFGKERRGRARAGEEPGTTGEEQTGRSERAAESWQTMGD